MNLQSIPFKINLDQYPYLLSDIAEALDRQSLYKSPELEGRVKVLEFGLNEDCRIFELFTKFAKKHLEKGTEWSVQSMDLRDSNFCELYHPVGLFDHNENKCTVVQLRIAYEKVLEALTGGWKEANIEDYPDLTFRKDPKNYHFFIKEQPVWQEDILVRFLATKYHLDKQLLAYETNKLTYMWIARDKLEDIIQKFGFKFIS